MVDLTEFEQLSRAHPNRCKMARHLDALGKKDRELCQAALDADHISVNSIRKWLDLPPRHLRIDDSTVEKHRTGKCCCVRSE